MGTLHFVPNRNITVVSNLSRGDMRVLVDIPLDANTDLDKIYQVIAQVNQSQQDKHPEVLTGPTILGPQIEKKWSLFLPYCDDRAKWDTGYCLSYLL